MGMTALALIGALLLLLGIVALCGLLLGYFAQKYKIEGDPLVEKIDAILP
ncbi:MAG: electron transporter RnfB, partial [Cardiobacterium sp.]